MQTGQFLTIQDLSAATAISLNVAIPVYASLGISTSVLPTALLSTQTEAFGKPAAIDLKDWVARTVAHWYHASMTFSGIAVGYVGTPALVDMVDQFIQQSAVSTVTIDPVMGDHGKLYEGFDQSYVTKMKTLIKQADVLTPNWTEAQLLVGDDPQPEMSESRVRDVLARLTGQLNDKSLVVITGIQRNSVLEVWWQTAGEAILHVENPLLDQHFYGAGDLFTAILSGLIELSWDADAAVKKTSELLAVAIKETMHSNRELRFGMALHNVIHELSKLDDRF